MAKDRSGSASFSGRTACAVAVIVLLGAYVRFFGLGSHSLWADEFATWHVSRMPPGASLQWGPELTKPPLYQFTLRAITDDPRPPEWVLRLPAAVAGTLTIVAAFALGAAGGGWIAGFSLASLVAFNVMQIEYSQQARSYSMLVAGATLSTHLWHRLVREASWLMAVLYVAAAAATVHAHYLMALVILAHAVWWAASLAAGLSVHPYQPAVAGRQTFSFRQEGTEGGCSQDNWKPVTALVGVGVLCTPILIHYLRFRTSTFQGLGWIPAASLGTALRVLGEISFGPVWIVVLAISIVGWVAAAVVSAKRRRAACANSRALFGGPQDICGLLLAWLFCSWFGLLIISWFAHPAMVNRYAIAASVPALMFPLVLAHRIDARLAVALALTFSAWGAHRWAEDRLEVEPGFRELSQYLSETVDPQRDAVVLTIDLRTHPEWADFEGLSFDYYPIRVKREPAAVTGRGTQPDENPIEVEPRELRLGPDGVTPLDPEVLRDPRRLYMVVLWADPFEILKRAGREPEPFWFDDQSYSQLLFSPYRLVKVAPQRPAD